MYSDEFMHYARSQKVSWSAMITGCIHRWVGARGLPALERWGPGAREAGDGRRPGAGSGMAGKLALDARLSIWRPAAASSRRCPCTCGSALSALARLLTACHYTLAAWQCLAIGADACAT